MIVRWVFVAILTSALFLWPKQAVFACETCALYSASRLQNLEAGAVSILINEQFSSFEKTADESTRNGDFTRSYSTTQLIAAYDIDERFGVQLNLPIVGREFDKVENFRTNSSTEGGIGDIAVLGSVVPFIHMEGEETAIFSLFSGVKFPTGDTGTLDDFVSEDLGVASSIPEGRNVTPNSLAHHSIGGVTGGRALTIGSGSFDYIFGAGTFLRSDRLFFLGSFQYALRTEGDHDYRFDNDTFWSAGPGVYLLAEHESTLGARAVLSGEHKGQDTLDGNSVADSQVSNLFVGPEILFTLNENISGELGLDLPVHTSDVELGTEIDYRLRFTLGFSF